MSYRPAGPLPRPEDRRRSDGEAALPWHTLPACVRSEAFAEDLSEAPSLRVARARSAIGALPLPLMVLVLVLVPVPVPMPVLAVGLPGR